jgi:murein DD-endopeptidase MepM/ murein hydrolase activator NlpD
MAIEQSHALGLGAKPTVSPVKRTAQDQLDPQGQKVVAQFEALMVHELLKSMRATVHASDEEEEEFGLELSTELGDQALADHVGGKMGIADVLARELGASRQGAAPTEAKRDDKTPAIRRFHGERMADFKPAQHHPAAPASAFAKSESGIVGFEARSAARLPVNGEISSPFGRRIHPLSGKASFHEGLDIAAAQGTEIRAVAAGEVVFAGKRGGYGNVVEIRHDDGVHTTYAHASAIHVQKGDRVEAGESVADVGSTGHSTGPHLHLEVHRHDRPIDPQRYLQELRSGSGSTIDTEL